MPTSTHGEWNAESLLEFHNKLDKIHNDYQEDMLEVISNADNDMSVVKRVVKKFRKILKATELLKQVKP